MKNETRYIVSDAVSIPVIRIVRACLTSPRARLDGGFSAQTSLKTLAIRQDCKAFCLAMCQPEAGYSSSRP